MAVPKKRLPPEPLAALTEPPVEFDVPIVDTAAEAGMRARVDAACETAQMLELPDGEDPEAAARRAEETLYLLAANAADPEALQKIMSTRLSDDPSVATYRQTKQVLDAYSVRVVEHAAQIRHMVTNKLILEAENPDPKIRLRALELLGKISDVGLFAEKSEVTVTHRSSSELVTTLRDKLAQLREGEAEDAVLVPEMPEPARPLDEALADNAMPLAGETDEATDDDC